MESENYSSVDICDTTEHRSTPFERFKNYVSKLGNWGFPFWRHPICIIFMVAFLQYLLISFYHGNEMSLRETLQNQHEYENSLVTNSNSSEKLRAQQYCPSQVLQPFPAKIDANSAILIFQEGLWWGSKTNYTGLIKCRFLPMKCRWTMDPAQYDEADAVAYHYKEHWVVPNKTKLTIGMCKEAFFDHLHHYYQSTNDTSHWQYNVSATHRLSSTIPTVYFTVEHLLKGMKKKPVFSEMQAGATFISSNCRSYTQRMELAQLLEKHIPVFSFGKCLNNMEWPPDGNKKDVVSVMGRYMLNFAFENTHSEDYVTEKLFNALASGAIPVFLGTNTVDMFLPCPDSIIRVADFPSVKALGIYLQKVISNETLFNFHHAWRYKKLPQELLDRFEFTKVSWTCRVCRYVYAHKFGCLWDQKRQQIGGLKLSEVN